MKRLFYFLCILFSVLIYAQKSDAAIKNIITNLTLEEKVFLVIGTGMDIPGVYQKADAPIAVVGSTKDKVEGAAGTSYAIKSAHLPSVVFADGPAGIRISPTREDAPNETFYATAFPTATSLASSWNLHLAKQIGEAFGAEGKAYGVDFLLAPALNIHRNPLGGRNFEYYAEDPFVSGKITAAFVNGVQSQGIGATIKHLVANNSETNRTTLNTVVSERALREIYLRGFKIAIEESNPWAIMSSYNKINGVYASENEELLTELLRNEWKYDGFVMTDWFGGKDAVAQMVAGNDLLMPGTKEQKEAIKSAVENGTLDEKILDRNIFNILKQYFKTPTFHNQTASNKPDLNKHKTIARQAATEGIVLLKNEKNALPMTPKNIAVFGVTSYETISGGTGSGDVNKAYMTSVFEGLNNANFNVDKTLSNQYSTYIKEEIEKMPKKQFFFEPDKIVKEKGFTTEELKTYANTNDAAIFTLGRTSGEFYDRKQENDFLLTTEELNEIKAISNAFRAQNKPFIIILNIGGVIETVSWKNYADAIVLAWQPGQEAGNAIADIITGQVTPSGKLTTTFPIAYADVSSSNNFPGTLTNPDAKPSANPMQAVPMEIVYEEGIYIGYRYYETFNVPVSFPFGYGKSYGNFNYGKVSKTVTEDSVTLSFSITNNSAIAGKEITQVYVKSPKGNIEKPSLELKGFAKTSLLAANASETVTITIPIKDLAYFDTASSSWRIDEGDYMFYVSSDIKTPKSTITISLKAKVIEKVTSLMAPKVALKELSKK